MCSHKQQSVRDGDLLHMQDKNTIVWLGFSKKEVIVKAIVNRVSSIGDNFI